MADRTETERRPDRRRERRCRFPQRRSERRAAPPEGQDAGLLRGRDDDPPRRSSPAARWRPAGSPTAAIALPAIGFALGPVFEEEDVACQDVGPPATSPPTTTSRVTITVPRASARPARRTAYVRKSNPASAGRDSPAGSSRSRRAARTSAARCAGSSAAERFVCPCHGGVYDFQGLVAGGPPVRPLDRFDTRVKNGQVQIGPRYSVNSELKRFSPRDPGEPLDGLWQYLYPKRFTTPRPPEWRSRTPEASASRRAASRRRRRASRRTARPPVKDQAAEVGAGHRRLGRRAHRRERLPARLPVPQGPEGDQLVLHARLRDDVRVPVAGGHGRVPGDVLRPGPDARLRQRPAHHQRRLPRLARARHAPLGRDGDDRPDLPAHGRGRSSSAPTSTRASSTG